MVSRQDQNLLEMLDEVGKVVVEFPNEKDAKSFRAKLYNEKKKCLKSGMISENCLKLESKIFDEKGVVKLEICSQATLEKRRSQANAKI